MNMSKFKFNPMKCQMTDVAPMALQYTEYIYQDCECIWIVGVGCNFKMN